MAEELSLLTTVEHEALEIREALPRARAIQAWVNLAVRRELSEDTMRQGVDYLRSLSPKQLKKIRKGLVSATGLIDEMPFVFEVSVGVPKDVLSENPDESIDDAGPGQTADVALLQPVEGQPGSTAEQFDTTNANDTISASDHEANESTALSEIGLKWARRVLGDTYDFDDKTVEDVARTIYEAAGTFSTRTQGDGRKIEPLSRIQRRLEGKSNKQIAEEEGYTHASVNQWFRHRIDINASRADAMSLTETADSVTESGSDIVVSSQETYHDTHDALQDGPIDLATLARLWSAEMGLDQDEEEHLAQTLDSSFGIELDGVHKSVRHRFRLFMKDRLPPLESSELDLDSNEKARLGALFGRVKEDGQYVFTAAPKSAYEITHEDGYLVPERSNQLLSGLRKIFSYMSSERQSASVVHEEPAESLQQATEQLNGAYLGFCLRNAGFSVNESEAIRECIEFDDEGQPKPRMPESQEALRKLQTVLAKNGNRLDPEGDRDVLASLRMLTNIVFGQKTVKDVYYKLHGRDQSISQADVTELLQDGIIKLTQLT